MNHLLEFYGTECTQCKEMHDLVVRLAQEEGVQVEQIEAWHNKANEKRLIELDCGRCNGVPFFYNTQTKKWLCGVVSYEELKNWALDI